MATGLAISENLQAAKNTFHWHRYRMGVIGKRPPDLSIDRNQGIKGQRTAQTEPYSFGLNG